MHVVAYISFFDNTLDQFIVHGASTWKEALKDAYIQMMHAKDKSNYPTATEQFEQIAQESVGSLPDDYNEACEEAFNQDWLFSVIEIDQ